MNVITVSGKHRTGFVEVTLMTRLNRRNNPNLLIGFVSSTNTTGRMNVRKANILGGNMN